MMAHALFTRTITSNFYPSGKGNCHMRRLIPVPQFLAASVSLPRCAAPRRGWQHFLSQLPHAVRNHDVAFPMIGRAD